MPNNNKVTNNQILGYDDLYKILTNYCENSELLTNDECLIGKYIEEAIKGPFEQDGLFCPIALRPILNPARTVFNEEGSSRSENLYEYSAILQWCHSVRMEDPCTKKTVEGLYIDHVKIQEIKEKLSKYFYKYYHALSYDKKENIDRAMNNIKLINLSKITKELISVVIKGDLETVNRLLSSGANANSTNKQGDNILVLAAHLNHVEIVKSLLNHGATVDLQDSMDFTALRLAIGRGNLEIVDILLRKGANVNAIDRDGNTPLIAAVRQDHLKIAEKLLSHRADLSIKNKSGQTPLDIVLEKGNVEMITFLKAAHRTAKPAGITLLEETQRTAKPASAISEIITAAFQRFYYLNNPIIQ